MEKLPNRVSTSTLNPSSLLLILSTRPLELARSEERLREVGKYTRRGRVKVRLGMRETYQFRNWKLNWIRVQLRLESNGVRGEEIRTNGFWFGRGWKIKEESATVRVERFRVESLETWDWGPLTQICKKKVMNKCLYVCRVSYITYKLLNI